MTANHSPETPKTLKLRLLAVCKPQQEFRPLSEGQIYEVSIDRLEPAPPERALLLKKTYGGSGSPCFGVECGRAGGSIRIGAWFESAE
jgi:hypothetical protein